jgi:plasmid stabilization system protein ParE
MARVAWSERASSDLRRLVNRLRRVASPATARKWAARLRTAVGRLESTPELGAPVEDADVDGLREWIIGPYRLVYQFDGTTCGIVAIVRAERDLGPALDDDA